MAQALIVLGDQTSHGGTVVEASVQSFTGNRAIARVGDQVTCPIHGNTVIASGDANVIIDGAAVARAGDTTACGAVLIASQNATTDC